MFKVVIEGFKTKDEAEEFINWYSGTGKQDILYLVRVPTK